MTYYVLTTVKNKLGITNMDLDTELQSCGSESDAYIDNRLGMYITVPIVSPDNDIIEAANYGAMGRFLKDRFYNTVEGQKDKSDEYLKIADKLIDAYINELLQTKTASKVPQYFVATAGNYYKDPNGL